MDNVTRREAVRAAMAGIAAMVVATVAKGSDSAPLLGLGPCQIGDCPCKHFAENPKNKRYCRCGHSYKVHGPNR
jgi:hypothetical protein